jgi:hypothetical protein
METVWHRIFCKTWDGMECCAPCWIALRQPHIHNSAGCRLIPNQPKHSKNWYDNL